MASVGAVDPAQYVPNLLQKMAFVESARRGGCGAECLDWPLLVAAGDPPGFLFVHGDAATVFVVERADSVRDTLTQAAERYGVWAAGLHGSDGELVP